MVLFRTSECLTLFINVGHNMLHVRRMMGTANSSQSSKLIRFNPEFTTPQATTATDDSGNVKLITSHPAKFEHVELRGCGDHNVGWQNAGFINGDDEADRLSLQQQETTLTVTPASPSVLGSSPTMTITCTVCSKGLTNGELIGGGNNLPYLKQVCDECFKVTGSSDLGGGDNFDNEVSTDCQNSQGNDQEFIQEFAILKSDSDNEGDADSLADNFFTTNSSQAVSADDASMASSSTHLESVKEPEPSRRRPDDTKMAAKVRRLPKVIICAGCEEGHQAIRLCNECGYICEECMEAHLKFRQLQRHTVSVVDELLKQQQPKQPHGVVDSGAATTQVARETIMPPERHQCDTHPDFELVLYCKGPHCQVPICAICTLETHDKLQGHIHVKLQEAVEEAMIQIKRTSSFLTDKKDLAMTAKFTLEKSKNALAEQHKDKVKELNEVVKDLHDSIDGHHSAALSKLDNVYKSETQSLEDNFETMQSVTEQVNTAYELVKGASNVTQSIDVLKTRDQIKESLRLLDEADMTKEIATPKLQPFSKEHYTAVDTMKQSLSGLFDFNDGEGKEQSSSSEIEPISEEFGVKHSAPGVGKQRAPMNDEVDPKAQQVTIPQKVGGDEEDDLQDNEQLAVLQKLGDVDAQVATLRKLGDDDHQDNEEVTATSHRLDDEHKHGLDSLRQDIGSGDDENREEESPLPQSDHHQPQQPSSSVGSSQASLHSEISRGTDFEDITNDVDGQHSPPDGVKSADLVHGTSQADDLPVISSGIAALYELNGDFQPKEPAVPSSPAESRDRNRDPQRKRHRSSSRNSLASLDSGRQSEHDSTESSEPINSNTISTDNVMKSADIVSSCNPPEDSYLPVISGIAALWELNGDFQPNESLSVPPDSPRPVPRQRSLSRNSSFSSGTGSTHSGFSRHRRSESSSEVMFSDGSVMSSGPVRSAALVDHEASDPPTSNGGIAALYELNRNYNPDELQQLQSSPPHSPDQPLRRSSRSRSSSISSEISSPGSVHSGFIRSRSSSRSSRSSFHSDSSRGSSRSLEPMVNNTQSTYSVFTGSPEPVRCITKSSLSTSTAPTSDLPKRSKKKQINPAKIDPSQCIAVLDRNLRFRKACKTKVRTFNSAGDPIKTGIADIRVLLEYDDGGWQVADDDKVVILDHMEGSYTIKFTPCWYGNHRLSVSIGGVQIRESPFMFWVPYCL